MKLIEALQEVGLNKKVRRKKWDVDYYVAADQFKQLCMYRVGKVRETWVVDVSDISADDWEITHNNVSFGKALVALKEGKRITNTDYHKAMEYIKIPDGCNTPHIFYDGSKGSVWNVCCSYLMSNTWVILD